MSRASLTSEDLVAGDGGPKAQVWLGCDPGWRYWVFISGVFILVFGCGDYFSCFAGAHGLFVGVIGVGAEEDVLFEGGDTLARAEEPEVGKGDAEEGGGGEADDEAGGKR